jgi:hypothetical protein
MVPKPQDFCNKVLKIIEVSPDSDVKEFVGFKLMREVDPEKDIVVQGKLILRNSRL